MRRQKTEVRSQKSEDKCQKTEGRGQKYLLTIMLACLLSSVLCSLAAYGSEKWQGVDESVVEKYAQEHGRTAHAPLINTDQGDLLLFVFLLAGAAGGFAAGYSWRMLITEKARDGAKSSAAQ